MEKLDLNANQFSGGFFGGIPFNLADLRYLDVSDNPALRGPLPVS